MLDYLISPELLVALEWKNFRNVASSLFAHNILYDYLTPVLTNQSVGA